MSPDDDGVARLLGISIDHVECIDGAGTATVSMIVTDDMTNAQGSGHGGIVFTLADEALAYASNAQGERTVSTSATIEWLQPVVVGQRLTATSTVLAFRGRSTIHDIAVTDDDDRLVAVVRAQTLTPGARAS